MTDTLSWLAEPQSIAYGGYSVVLARGLEPAELVARIAAEAFPRRTALPLGPCTGEDLIEDHELDFSSGTDDVALRYGQADGLAYAVAYGYWQGELSLPDSVSRGGADVYHVEYEEENGKPVPPQFHSSRDGRPLCAFNLHLDSSWGFDGVDGDPVTAAAVTADLAAAGLPDPENRRYESVHRTCLELLGRRFGLTLPRAAVVDGELPAVLLEAA